MCVTGLTEESCDLINFSHVTAMADFAFRLREQLENVNEHSFNNFKIRIGKKNALVETKTETSKQNFGY